MTKTVSAFECKREDLTIRGTVYRPEGDNLPVAIISHGFGGNQEMSFSYADVLSDMGYVAFAYDFCGGSFPGTGKSDGETTEMSALTEVKDLEAVIAYAQSLDYTSDELLLMGCSQGGFVSAMVSAKHPGLVSKAVLFFPAFCIPDDARKGQMLAAKFDPKNPDDVIDCGIIKLGKCYPLDVMEMDYIEEIKAYEGPVLIVHGTADAIVNVDYSIKAEKEYKNCKLVIIENGDHGFNVDHEKIAVTALKEFAQI